MPAALLLADGALLRGLGSLNRHVLRQRSDATNDVSTPHGYLQVSPADWIWRRSFGAVNIYTSDSLVGSYGPVSGRPWTFYASSADTHANPLRD